MTTKKTRPGGNAPGLPAAKPLPADLLPRSDDAAAALPGADLRALELHDVVPAGHVALLVTDTRWAPHLRPGELAIVDTTDTKPQLGELYALTIQCSRLPRGSFVAIVQPYRSVLSGADGVMYRFGAAWGSTADGPLLVDWWHRKCRGRVVGVLVPEITGRDHV